MKYKAQAKVLRYVVGCANDVGTPLQVKFINRTSNRALIVWSGIDLDNVRSCQVSYGVQVTNNTALPQYTIIPVNSEQIVLSNLSASAYSLFVECTDNNNVAHKSAKFLIPATSEYSLHFFLTL